MNLFFCQNSQISSYCFFLITRSSTRKSIYRRKKRLINSNSEKSIFKLFKSFFSKLGIQNQVFQILRFTLVIMDILNNVIMILTIGEDLSDFPLHSKFKLVEMIPFKKGFKFHFYFLKILFKIKQNPKS
jgi:hypothetical protein